jgi:hypothetical protein
MNQQQYFKILFGILTAVSCTFADSTSIYNNVIREDVFAAKTTSDFSTAYSKSTDPASKIAVLNAIPMAINRFQANVTGTTVPAWLGTLLTSALQDKNIIVVQTAVNQISQNNIVCYADILISMYGSPTVAATDNPTIYLRTAILNALGTFGTANSIILFGKIIDAHIVCSETEAALNGVASSCATSLVPNINSYVTDLTTKIQNKVLMTSSPVATVQVSPDGSLQHSYGVVRNLGNGNCGK